MTTLPRGIRTLVRGFAFGVPIVITFVDIIGYVAKVEGVSMQPSLNPDTKITDYVLLNRWSIRKFCISRGDIVSLFSPRDPDQKIIKRVIGLEGDTIRTRGYKDRYVRVPLGHCWVEGDHYGHSLDSNSFGPVPLGLVNAHASHIVWPPKRWRRLERHVPEERRPLNLTPPELQMLLPDKFGPDPSFPRMGEDKDGKFSRSLAAVSKQFLSLTVDPKLNTNASE